MRAWNCALSIAVGSFRGGGETALMGGWRILHKKVLGRMGGVCSTQDVETKGKLLIGKHE